MEHPPGFQTDRHLCRRIPSETPYYYSTYAEENESLTTEQPKVLIIGSGPNRIGQGIEFDYCCVHAVMAAKEAGYEAIMLNCNPETVSTDYDISDRLYFEPVTFEDVMHVIELERPIGVIVQLGGQTPLKLAKTFGGRDYFVGNSLSKHRHCGKPRVICEFAERSQSPSTQKRACK